MIENIILNAEENREDGEILVYRKDSDKPIITQNCRHDHRPYIHPIIPPDDKGPITEYSPGHHTHQTGLYWGFTRINGNDDLIPEGKLYDWFYGREYKHFQKPDGTWDKEERTPEEKEKIAKAAGRDYFHNPRETHWQLISASVTRPNGEKVSWQTVYNMLGDEGECIMIETQNWTVSVVDGKYLLTLEWLGHAQIDITVNKFDYGGMFLRMPWRKEMPAEVINAAGHKDLDAEGQSAKWLDIGMQVEGRDDLAHISIFDHPENGGAPTAWRVDGEFGVGPTRAINGDWSIRKGETEIVRHQLLVFTGNADTSEIEELWKTFAKGERL